MFKVYKDEELEKCLSTLWDKFDDPSEELGDIFNDILEGDQAVFEVNPDNADDIGDSTGNVIDAVEFCDGARTVTICTKYVGYDYSIVWLFKNIDSKALLDKLMVLDVMKG